MTDQTETTPSTNSDVLPQATIENKREENHYRQESESMEKTANTQNTKPIRQGDVLDQARLRPLAQSDTGVYKV